MSQMRKTLHEKKYPPQAIVIGGMLGGISEIVVTYPLDTIKTHLQIYPNRYRGILHCGSSIIYNNGLRGLYYGVYASLFQVASKASLRFTIYDYLKNKLHEGGINGNSKNFIAGVSAGTIESILWTAPTERIKILQQKTATNSLKYKSSYYIIKDLYYNQGLRGLFIGTSPTIMKQSLSIGSRFWCYEKLKNYFMDANNHVNPLTTIFIGGIAGGISTLINHPIDVIKSYIQANESSKEGIISCGKKIIKKNGYLGLMKGLNARFTRVVIAQGVTFAVYESYISLYR